jgi:hypothetical protein
MRRHVLVLTTTAAILACGAIAAGAQAPAVQTPGTQQSPTIQPTPGGPMSQDQTIRDRLRERLQDRVQTGDEEDSDQDGFFRYHRGMMGMMGGGMMGRGYGHHDSCRDRGILGPMIMRVIFSLMDADGDGKLTLQEFQAAHERIFKAMDADHDGTVTLQEMQDFMRGISRPASQQ